MNTPSTPVHRHAIRPRVLAVAAAAGMLFAGAGAALSEESIGDAKVIINNVSGDIATGGERQVAQGDNVFLNESVKSEIDSKASLVLRDSTNVTVGPNSTVKLDSFVYSGPKQPGTIALNMAKGTFRFVTGDASKKAYTIVTPTAAIGVRGTILRIRVTDTETTVINEEGTGIVCHRNRGDTASVEELRKRRCTKEQKAQGKCGCTELTLPNQQATISSNEPISITEAPPDAISEPIITEAVPGTFPAPLGAVGLIGGAVIGGIVAGNASGNSKPPSP